MIKFNSKYFSSNTTKIVENLRKKVDTKNIKTITMGFPDLYGRFMGKKYDPDYFFDGIVQKGSNACNYLLGCDLDQNPLPNAKLSSFDLGYGDFTMKTDFDSMREVNYVNGNTQLLFFSDLYDAEVDTRKIDYAPRWLLKNQIQQLEENGIKVNIDCEINFTAFHGGFRKNMDNIPGFKKITDHNNLANTFYASNYEKMINDLTKACRFSKIPVDRIYGDSGEGQFKICLNSSSPVDFSDNIVLLKLVSFILFLF